jgi:hypothetical protein
MQLRWDGNAISGVQSGPRDFDRTVHNCLLVRLFSGRPKNRFTLNIHGIDCQKKYNGSSKKIQQHTLKIYSFRSEISVVDFVLTYDFVQT